MAETKKTTAKKSQSAAPRIDIPSRLIDFQKRILNGQKAAFDSTFNAVTAVQDSQDKAFHGLLDRASFVPEEAKEIAETWAENRRSARESYKETVHRSFTLVEEWMDGLAGSSA